MKNKLYLLVLLALTGLNANAQSNILGSTTAGKPSFGIFGGIDFQNINGKDAAGEKLTNSLVTRFNVGINYEMPIAPEFYIQPGLQFITKGTKGPMSFTTNNETHSITREIKLSYIELPINLVYKPLLGTNHFILGFGPYVGYGVGGKAKFTGTTAPQDADIEFTKTAPSNDANNLIYFKRMDAGANFFVGYEFENGLNFLLNSQLGLVNINATTSTKMENKNTGFGLAIGYRFL